ncbi:MAG TPA: esterase-like activity of phytase family protein, partial [Phenylobacterium sp.]|nr:esterase-like activity of phytase family protein [Phenylobacterium sp.]
MPSGPMPAGDGIAIQTTPVPLNPDDPAQARLGDFVYAGGVALASDQTSRLHGLSDIVVRGDRLWAISDDGDAFEGRLVLDKAGRLIGVTDGRLTALTGPDGKPLQGKAFGDAEGLAILPNGDRLVSFEREHRIWRYPAEGGPPVPAPMPEVAMAENDGMEAITADPEVAADAYAVGVEATGAVFACRLSAKCRQIGTVEKTDDFGLVAMTKGPGEHRVTMLRAWDPLRGNRIIVRVKPPNGERAELPLARPLTVDNFEGAAAVAGPGGALRLYILSDDNFQSSQRTLLLAFDWKPSKPA